VNECQGLLGRWFGHNYQPVFNRTPPSNIDGISGTRQGVLDLVRVMTRTQYVHTCCTRCGREIEKGQP